MEARRLTVIQLDRNLHPFCGSKLSMLISRDRRHISRWFPAGAPLSDCALLPGFAFNIKTCANTISPLKLIVIQEILVKPVTHQIILNKWLGCELVQVELFWNYFYRTATNGNRFFCKPPLKMKLNNWMDPHIQETISMKPVHRFSYSVHLMCYVFKNLNL